MSSDVDGQAAEWFSRLRSRSVGNAELAEFARWRRTPGNADAYARVERLWADAELLESDPQVALAIDTALLGSARRRLPPMLIALGAIGLVLVATLSIMVLQPGTETYRTAIGERSAAPLEDGSRIDVDADSEVQVNYRSRARSIHLVRGQALFSVRHDDERPFMVEAPLGVSIRAVGTRFDVRADGRTVLVALVEGRLEVRRDGALIANMVSGERLVVARDAPSRLSSGQAAEAVQWTSGRLVFRGTPLRAAVAEINRYALPRVDLLIGGRGAEPISGEFSTDDPDGFVRGVNALVGAGTLDRNDREAE